MAKGWRESIADRLGLTPLAEKVLHRRVAKGEWYYGDGAALVLLLGVQVVTGGIMALTYVPSIDGAYESVRYITYQQTLEWFIRSLHYWSAGLMVVMVVWHMLRQVLIAGYKSPREGTWLIGVAMMALVVVMSFTGYVLRWDERAVYAARVAMTIFHQVPVIGEGLVVVIQGGPEMGQQTLSRFYAVHVILVPGLLLLLVAWHLYLVMLHGVTSTSERRQPVASVEEQRELYRRDAASEERGEEFFPFTAAKSGAFALVVFLVAIGLAVFAGPATLYPEANLVERSAPAEEWWFWWYSALVALLPRAIAGNVQWLLPLLLLAVLVLLPFVDRSGRRGIRKRPLAVAVVVLVVISLLWLTDLRRRSPWTAWPRTEPPPIPQGVELEGDAAAGRLLFVSYGCFSCHAVSGVGPRVGTDLARMEHRYSLDELKEYILNPPEDIPMPSYAGRIPEDHLERVAAFVLVAQTFPRQQEPPRLRESRRADGEED